MIVIIKKLKLGYKLTTDGIDSKLYGIDVDNLHSFYRAKRSVPRYCHDKLSVRLSVRLSVTLVDCDHTRCNSAKITSRLISLGTWHSADPNITDLLHREHP